MSEKTRKLARPSPRDTAAAATETPLKIRIGRIRYANSLPFFHRLSEDPSKPADLNEAPKREVLFEFLDECPAALNRALEEEKIDMGPISSLAYLHHQDDWALLPDLAIGSRDFSGSVILFSRIPIEHLQGEAVAVSEESLSSALLLEILLKFKYKFSNHLVPVKSDPVSMLEQFKAALLIGDHALFYQHKEFVYKYDLSELWWNWTGKPFCFALWAVRHKFAAEYPAEAGWAAQRIRRNRDRNLQDIELLLKDTLGLSFLDERFSKLFGYLFNLNYGLDAAMQDGLQLFYRLAHRLGVSPRAKPLEFFVPEC